MQIDFNYYATYCAAFLAGWHGFFGFVDVLRAVEDRRGGGTNWELKLLSGHQYFDRSGLFCLCEVSGKAGLFGLHEYLLSPEAERHRLYPII